MKGGDFLIAGVAALMNGRGCFDFHFLLGSEEETGKGFELRQRGIVLKERRFIGLFFFPLNLTTCSYLRAQSAKA